MRVKVLHLIDDATAGGVTQVVRHLTTCPRHALRAEHRSMKIKRGTLDLPQTDADVIVSHLAMSWRTLPSLIALRLRYGRERLIHVEHSYTGGFVAWNVPAVGRFMTMLRLGFRQFGRVAAVSRGQMRWLASQGLVPSERLHLVRSYSDLSGFLACAPQHGPVRHFGAIGRLERQKGFDVLIDAFRQTDEPDLRLTFFGDGSDAQALMTRAAGDPRIRFAGFAADATAAYRAVDAVVMPSRWEAYGLVALEALASGKRLIAADVDGLRDHAGIGATLYDRLDRQVFSMPQTDPPWRAERERLVDGLCDENLSAWDAVLTAVSARQERGRPVCDAAA